ncbi:MAG: HNH endonuclease [Deltaproteobacteria bacterium]|nr:HNH endonuclease [Deltaproteobacteria bacterium]
MTTYISAALRQLVATRAEHLCEYCLIHEDDAYFGCEVDHIISEKHGGQTEADNLAYACVFCNRSKGSDVGSVIRASGVFVRFFNPRTDLWAEHFILDGVSFVALSDVGEVSIRILGLNNSERIFERQILQIGGRFPSAAATARMARRA